MVGGAAAAAAGLMWRRDLGGFWPGLIAFVAVLAVGIVLGQLAGRLLCRPSSDGPPEDKKGHPEEGVEPIAPADAAALPILWASRHCGAAAPLSVAVRPQEEDTNGPR